MSSSNCCFLTCIQVSQEEGQVVWYSHLFQNFPQSFVIHTIKGFGIVNKAEIDAFFSNSLAYSMIQQMLAIWSLVPLPFLIPSWISGSSRFTYCWSLAWRILSITLLVCAAAVAAATSLQSCPMLCNPIDGSPPGPVVPGFSRQEHWSGLPFTYECNCVVVWVLFGIVFLWDWNENWPFPVLWPLLSFPNLLAYGVQHFHSIIF